MLFPGQASSPTAEAAGLMASTFAEIGWQIASQSGIPPQPQETSASGDDSSTGPTGQRQFSTSAAAAAAQKGNMSDFSRIGAQDYSTSSGRDIPGVRVGVVARGQYFSKNLTATKRSDLIFGEYYNGCKDDDIT